MKTDQPKEEGDDAANALKALSVVVHQEENDEIKRLKAKLQRAEEALEATRTLADWQKQFLLPSCTKWW